MSFPPYVHRAARGNSITPARQRAFISALAGSGIVTQAARAIGASLEALYKLRRLEGAEGFAAAWEMALERGLARLEDCALERAIAGEERPVVRGGEVVTTWRRYDTPLLVFLLRQRRPEAYNDGRFLTRRELREAKREAFGAWHMAAAMDDGAAVRASLDAKLAKMAAAQRAKESEHQARRHSDGCGDGGGDGDGGA